jgi:hypothetical protein
MSIMGAVINRDKTVGDAFGRGVVTPEAHTKAGMNP